MARYGTCRYGTKRYSQRVPATMREVMQRMDHEVPPDEDLLVEIPVGASGTGSITVSAARKRVLGRRE